MKSGSNHLTALALLLLPAAFVAAFFLAPLAISAGQSVGMSLDFSGYKRLVDAPVYLAVFRRTVRVATLVSLLCTVFGFICAYYIATLGSRGRAIAIALISLPFMLSVLVRNYVWMLLLQDTGLVNRVLLRLGIVDEPVGLMYNQFAVQVAMVNMLLPYTILPILAALLAIPKEVFAASESLGASPVRTFYRITVPLALPGIAVGALLTFIIGLGFYITPAMLGGPREVMVSNLIAFNVRESLNWTLAFSMSTSLLGITIFLYVMYRLLLPQAPKLRVA